MEQVARGAGGDLVRRVGRVAEDRVAQVLERGADLVQESALRTRLDECLCSHGEENAIIQAAYHGVVVRGGTIYTTFSPCLTCTKMIINSGLIEVVYNVAYPLGDVSLGLLREAGVKVRQVTLAAA